MNIDDYIYPLGFLWDTENPFLFLAHHEDFYPEGDGQGAPKTPLKGRSLGNDFDMKNPWKMYHGLRVPGFPEHPHRGFETVTITLEGMVDHFDSAGAYGRYGNGDVQWMTAGSGLEHCEMFPLLNDNMTNTLHLFQVWLNLPAKDKFVAPHYKMLWAEEIPEAQVTHEGVTSTVRVIAGDFSNVKALEPSPDSYATKEYAHVDIWHLVLPEGGSLTLRAKSETQLRNLYFYEGETVLVNDQPVRCGHRIKLVEESVTLVAKEGQAKLLFLGGEPILEPVVKYGPFVMNTMEEIREAYDDFQRTGFGEWPWKTTDPILPVTEGRQAQYSDGTRHLPKTLKEDV